MDKPPLYFKLWIWLLDRANWKDRGQLKRGQLVTTISEMQEAMSYYSGYRKITPTKDEIRSAYGFFGKTSMVASTKTTRGMVITINNYELYQNPKNYGPHSVPPNGTQTEPTVTPHDTERIEKESMKKEKKPLPPEALRLSELLADLILDNNPGNSGLSGTKRATTITRWSTDIEKINRLDGQSWADIEAVIGWCQGDSFWRGNILTGSKLREKFDQLTTKMAVKPAGGNGRQQAYTNASRGAM